MPAPLRVLIVEDNPDDCELMVLHLTEEGFQPDWQRVEIEADYLAALEPPPDLILSDWSLPNFSGKRALQLLAERDLDIPFVIVSGKIGEEDAIEAIHQGADDYVLKDRPARLGLAARRAMEANQLHKIRKQGEDELRASHELLAKTFASLTDAIFIVDDKTIKILDCNPAASEIFGYSRQEMLGQTTAFLHIDEASLEEFRGHLNSARKEKGFLSRLEFKMKRKDGTIFLTEHSVTPLEDDQGNQAGWVSVVHDITERKRNEQQIEQQIQRLNTLRIIDMAIAGTVDLHLTLNIALEQIIMQMGVDAADVLLLNPVTHILEYSAGRGFRTNAIELSRMRPGEGHAGRAALERQTIHISDLKIAVKGFVLANLYSSESFVDYSGVPLIAKGEVKGVLEVFHRTPFKAEKEWLDFLETLAGHVAIALDSAKMFTDLQLSNLELAIAYDTTLEGWSKSLDLRNKETEDHTLRVTEMTVGLARDMGVSEGNLAHIRHGAMLHDIGKMGIPDSVLLKPGPLTDDEWVIMRKHPTYAYELLSPIAYLHPAMDIPYNHHEKWDGSGYPRGLKGEQIPLAARLFAVVDVWDALISDRPYRKAWSMEKTMEHIKSGTGAHFDPKVVDAFLRARNANAR